MRTKNVFALTDNPNAEISLVWIPHAGGSAAYFTEMSNLLPQKVQALAVEYPGRGRRFREPLCDDLMTISNEVALSLACMDKKPYILFGHSMGATVAFEACRLLKSVGAKNMPQRIFISASEPPHVLSDTPILHKFSDNVLLNYLEEMNGSRFSESDRKINELTLPVIRNDLTACETHRFFPTSKLDTGLTIYYGSDDPIVREDSIHRWSQITYGDVKIRSFQGGHFYFKDAEKIFKENIKDDINSVLIAISRINESLPY